MASFTFRDISKNCFPGAISKNVIRFWCNKAGSMCRRYTVEETQAGYLAEVQC